MRWCARTSTPRRSTKRATGTTAATPTSPTAAPSSTARSAGRWSSAAARLLGDGLLRRRLLGGRPFRDGLLGGGPSWRRLRDRGLLGDSLVRSRLFRWRLGSRRPRHRRGASEANRLRIAEL